MCCSFGIAYLLYDTCRVTYVLETFRIRYLIYWHLSKIHHIMSAKGDLKLFSTRNMQDLIETKPWKFVRSGCLQSGSGEFLSRSRVNPAPSCIQAATAIFVLRISVLNHRPPKEDPKRGI